MKISVITINYNNIDGLRKTVESVLSQTYQDVEYIIIDGGSKDGAAEYLASQKGLAYWCSETDMGLYNAMNKGIRKSIGDYLIFMNSGDRFFDRNVLSEIFNGKTYASDSLYGSTIYEYEDGCVLRHPRDIDKVMPKELPFCHQSAFIKGDLMRERLYDEQYRFIADYHFFYNIWKEGKSFEQVNKIVAVYDGSGMSANSKNGYAMYEESCLIHEIKPSENDFKKQQSKSKVKNCLRTIIPPRLRNMLHPDKDVCKYPIAHFQQI